jgi:hypothetical protein
MISGSSAHIQIHGTNISHNNGSEGGGLYVFTVSCELLLLGWFLRTAQQVMFNADNCLGTARPASTKWRSAQ